MQKNKIIYNVYYEINVRFTCLIILYTRVDSGLQYGDSRV